MEPDLDESLDAHSQFVPINMGHSLVSTSEKVYFNNASTVNQQQFEKDKKYLPAVNQQEEQSQNQFLDVGKWKKSKQSSLNKDMATVKEQVDQIITQTRWRKKEKPQSEEVIADQSIVPDQEDGNGEEGEIQDQTQKEEESSSEEEEEEESSSEEEQEQQEEESEESQEQEEEEQQEEEEEEKGEEESQPEIESPISIKQTPTYNQKNYQLKQPTLKSTKSQSNKSKVQSHMSEDDRTDAQSQMKKTEYLPSKWVKKGSVVGMVQDPWKRKQGILLRILKLCQ